MKRKRSRDEKSNQPPQYKRMAEPLSLANTKYQQLKKKVQELLGKNLFSTFDSYEINLMIDEVIIELNELKKLSEKLFLDILTLEIEADKPIFGNSLGESTLNDDLHDDHLFDLQDNEKDVWVDHVKMSLIHLLVSCGKIKTVCEWLEDMVTEGSLTQKQCFEILESKNNVPLVLKIVNSIRQTEGQTELYQRFSKFLVKLINSEEISIEECFELSKTVLFKLVSNNNSAIVPEILVFLEKLPSDKCVELCCMEKKGNLINSNLFFDYIYIAVTQYPKLIFKIIKILNSLQPNYSIELLKQSAYHFTDPISLVIHIIHNFPLNKLQKIDYPKSIECVKCFDAMLKAMSELVPHQNIVDVADIRSCEKLINIIGVFDIENSLFPALNEFFTTLAIQNVLFEIKISSTDLILRLARYFNKEWNKQSINISEEIQLQLGWLVEQVLRNREFLEKIFLSDDKDIKSVFFQLFNWFLTITEMKLTLIQTIGQSMNQWDQLQWFNILNLLLFNSQLFCIIFQRKVDSTLLEIERWFDKLTPKQRWELFTNNEKLLLRGFVDSQQIQLIQKYLEKDENQLTKEKLHDVVSFLSPDIILPLSENLMIYLPKMTLENLYNKANPESVEESKACFVYLKKIITELNILIDQKHEKAIEDRKIAIQERIQVLINFLFRNKAPLNNKQISDLYYDLAQSFLNILKGNPTDLLTPTAIHELKHASDMFFAISLTCKLPQFLEKIAFYLLLMNLNPTLPIQRMAIRTLIFNSRHKMFGNKNEQNEKIEKNEIIKYKEILLDHFMSDWSLKEKSEHYYDSFLRLNDFMDQNEEDLEKVSSSVYNAMEIKNTHPFYNHAFKDSNNFLKKLSDALLLKSIAPESSQLFDEVLFIFFQRTYNKKTYITDNVSHCFFSAAKSSESQVTNKLTPSS